jgi:hypothetical protein
MYIVSQILGTAINKVMIFQYVNIVLIVKQSCHHMKHLLLETDSTTEVETSKCVYFAFTILLCKCECYIHIRFSVNSVQQGS